MTYFLFLKMSFLEEDETKKEIDQKKKILKKLREERREQYLKTGHDLEKGENSERKLLFSNDLLKIPYISSDEHEYLIDGTKCYETEQINYNNEFMFDYTTHSLHFYRQRTKDEEQFMKDYNKLISYSQPSKIRNYEPNSNNKFTLTVFEQLKASLIKNLPSSSHQNTLQINFSLDNGGYPYRSYSKLKSLYDDFNTYKFKSMVKPLNNFDEKESKNKYSLKTYSNVKYSFIGDIFFESNISAFLLLININTRYAYAYQLGEVDIKEIINVDENNKEYEMKYTTKGKKTTEELIKAFNMFLKDSHINILRFDGERAIGSEEFKKYLKKNNIKFIPAIPGVHTSLSLIDRLCRTLRDIAFN